MRKSRSAQNEIIARENAWAKYERTQPFYKRWFGIDKPSVVRPTDDELTKAREKWNEIKGNEETRVIIITHEAGKKYIEAERTAKRTLEDAQKRLVEARKELAEWNDSPDAQQQQQRLERRLERLAQQQDALDASKAPRSGPRL